ncbi:MAG: hypothetical protein J0I17_12400 ['Candidatus Kapabacteria' thiocyanatum]|uniref:DUF4856 domain-containing protein n=1 Tax=Candidatus Kapaibacterium thiocyanatum TaxID=1895771 RepID=A0A1M3L187_9BACT|nr:hypothetical protein ['Candidatus Kapabacteria' thiocyanatum]OJX58720.1 MAG: hypothetical protein BGO89_05240 ['Candidatus Kapabacteria' thiocyanatum]
MMNMFRTMALVAVSAAVLAGCSDSSSNPKDPLSIPAVYDSTSYRTNAAAEYQIRTQLASLVSLMKTGRTSGTRVSQSELEAKYAPLASLTTSYYAGRVGQSLATLASASGGTYDPSRPVAENGEGGVFNGYLFDKYGLECEQQVEKGLFAALLYNQAVAQMSGDVTPAKIDRMIAAFGAHPSFPNTDKAASNPDVFCAAYAARRDKNDGNGFYSTMKKNFLKARAAAAAGSNYNAELNEALGTIRDTWERTQMATIVNYLYSTISTLSATNLDDKGRASALHAYGECVGFMHGWRGVSPSMKIISDTKIDELLILMRAPVDGPARSYELVTQPVTALPDLARVISEIKVIYGFTDADLQDFKQNWVAVQNRQ